MLFISQIISRIFRHPFTRQLASRYPAFFRFLQLRFSPAHFFGLPFTFILIIIFLNLMLLSELVETVANSAGMKSVEGQISLLIFSMRIPWLSNFFFWFTQLGSFYGLVAVSSLFIIFLLLKRKFYFLLGFLISVLGSGAAVKITKAYFVRERPLDIGFYTETSFSFPSGHATGAVALEGFICYILFMQARSPRAKTGWFLIGLIYCLLMGFSRIYLGVHFATDVLAGYLLGLLWLLLGVIIMEYAALKKIRFKFNA